MNPLQKPKSLISIIIPAWNEEETLGTTLESIYLLNSKFQHHTLEIIVVDDGSTDYTRRVAIIWADKVIRHSTNLGKGAALTTGIKAASGDILMFLDADLGKSGVYADLLVEPIIQHTADMSIAVFPPAKKRGFGILKTIANQGASKMGGFKTKAALSGQRAIRREVLEEIGGLSDRFGIEVGLTIDVARHGYKICEVRVPFSHHETGKTWSGFMHRGKQLLDVGKVLVNRWKYSPRQ
ncbi:glycosyltransferase family 2 protein [Longirhabdus pacifica]|uniref:glycosyltransferase family 2 protein n=1 Tax=Longirhabdus pacifica TaxID=2305227 RepID=UPI001008C856|nr:glycosyltransferase family 2 protein [Longirhabdus pacifica]